MTTEELILGHFDRALTPEQEKLLQERLSASPEARTMFEQHRHLDSYLSTDAMALAPSASLDEATIAAALSVIPEAIGSGSATWFSGKIVATISAVIIGGASIALFSTSGPSENVAPAPKPSVVRTLPTAPAPASVPAPDAVAPKDAPATVPSETSKPAPARAARAKASTVKDGAKAQPKGSKLEVPAGTSTIKRDPKVVPSK